MSTPGSPSSSWCSTGADTPTTVCHEFGCSVFLRLQPLSDRIPSRPEDVGQPLADDDHWRRVLPIAIIEAATVADGNAHDLKVVGPDKMAMDVQIPSFLVGTLSATRIASGSRGLPLIGKLLSNVTAFTDGSARRRSRTRR